MTYLDASALVKWYVEEEGSDRVRQLMARGSLATSRLSEVEVASAVARRSREGSFPAAERDRVFAALPLDLAVMFIVELTPGITARCCALLTRHRLRASDSVQLASGLYLSEQAGTPLQFVAFDERLLEAAQAEGLETPIN
jgi:predicted nucleic acid-binding protein